ncbi:TGF-beta receptor type-2-like isoform X2 [Synchiropus splendidus]|uniref:TGF-beta receptor type-2-like isoform X2 n=1 Tax=Synchiropus splendidus TaxID=270530 RepID=UPI00237DEFC6|nr:TGF-beta receptor type-2-like isoform X2 [Synchiropus splendidus]
MVVDDSDPLSRPQQPNPLAALVESSSHLNFNFCKWCEASRPVCREQLCLSNCSEGSFCGAIEELCVAVWRKNNESTVVQTMCHNPALPLEGVQAGLSRDGFSRECHMTPALSDDGAVMVCGCRGAHECNDRLLFHRPPARGFARLRSTDVLPVVMVSLAPLLLVALTISATFYCYRSHQAGRPSGHPGRAWTSKSSAGLRQVPDQPCGSLRFLGEVTPPEDDGAGAELLPIRLETVVGRGRFAEVWRATLLAGGEDVAVKVFPALECSSWRSERSILADPNLQHHNVVRFLAAEERATLGHRTFWLVLDYHGRGNLQDFLRDHVLSWQELVVMATSVARGLAYLHSDTTTSGEPKVPVAHRDLKSSNVMVKQDQQCALCDFGLALRLDLALTTDDLANSGQVGTARYMAPEVLESRVNLEDPETFKQMDVYSLALVLWEMGSRCRAAGEVRSYQPVFGSQVCDQPSVDSMRELVLRDRGRPQIPLTWTQHQGMSVFCSTVVECWDHDPEARLTAHCVLERFSSLEREAEPAPQQRPRQATGRSKSPPPPRRAGASICPASAPPPSAAHLL